MRDDGRMSGVSKSASSAASSVAAEQVMAQFSPPTRDWFLAAFSQPTPAQQGAWQAISAGANALVVAPTGSGKTLAAFLWALDTLVKEGTAAAQPSNQSNSAKGSKVLYISPLKAVRWRPLWLLSRRSRAAR